MQLIYKMPRNYKNMKAGSSGYGEGTAPPQTQGYSNGATDPQEDGANAGSADGDKLNELNNIQGGGRRRRRGKQHGGNNDAIQPPTSEDSGDASGDTSSGEVKAINVQSPARETASGPYTTDSQVTANQESSNQGLADTKYDNVGGGKRRRKRRTRGRKSRGKSKSKKSKGKKKTVKKSRSKRTKKR